MQGSLQRIERSKGLTKVEEGSRKGGSLGWGMGGGESRCQYTLEACLGDLHLCQAPALRLEVQRTAVSLIGLTRYHLLVAMYTFTWGAPDRCWSQWWGANPTFVHRAGHPQPGDG